MKILVTGSRDWDDWLIVDQTLRQLNPENGLEHTLIQGGARGADQIAFDVAQTRGWRVKTEPAKWAEHGKAAGPIRNQVMVDMAPDICVVFHRNQSRGAADCGLRAEKAGIPTYWVVYEDLDA